MSQQQSLELVNIELSKLKSSKTNPRKTFDEESIKELAASIIEKGVLQPIVVRKIQDNGSYEIVVGERRFRASKIAAQSTIPAMIRELNDDEVIELQIIENLQRKDVHPMEEAAGFRQLVSVKKFDAAEIARRLGKSPHYVAQRLKLNELIPEWQKAFFEERISMHDALSVCKISGPDQTDLWKNKKRDGDIGISNWDLKKYLNRLNDAPFDVTDPNLKKDMGACTTCPFNSAVNTLLFPDQASNPTCLNSSCFRQKCNLSYDKELKKSIEDPEVVLIREYSYQTSKESEALTKKNIPVLSSDQYSEIQKPAADDYDVDRDDYDSDKEFQDELKSEAKRYQEEQQRYENKIKTGKFRKAFMVDGDDKGKIVFIEIRKKASSTEAKKKVDAGEASQTDLKTEISRIQEREKRSKQLDEEKIWELLQKELTPVKTPILKGKLIQVEREAIATSIANKTRHSHESAFNKLFGKDHSKVTEDTLLKMMRFFFLSVLPPETLYSGFTNDARVCVKVAGVYLPKTLKEILDNQNAIATKRQARVDQRITQLREMMKPKKVETTAQAVARKLKDEKDSARKLKKHLKS